MKDQQGRKIDTYFRESLSDPELPFNEDHWLDMQYKLEKKNKRGYFFWGIAIGSAAALFLLVLTWWLAGSTLVPGAQPMAKNNAVKRFSAPANTKTGVKATIDLPVKTGIVKMVGQTGSRPETNLATVTAKRTKISRGNGEKNYSGIASVKMPADNGVILASAPRLTNGEDRMVNAEQVGIGSLARLSEAKTIDPDVSVVELTSPVDTSRVAPLKKPAFKPVFSLAIVAAPDFSSVNSFSNSKRGMSGGITATVSLSPKISVTTGLLLAKKIYETGYSNYKPASTYKFPTNPLSVSADCRVLDVPVNVGYTFFNQGKTSISGFAGASSYFMLREDYTFNYQTYTYGPKAYELKNKNRHYLGVGNLGVTVERKLTKQVGLAIQPYAKVPLTPIGYGHVKLFSAGAILNLNVNFSRH